MTDTEHNGLYERRPYFTAIFLQFNADIFEPAAKSRTVMKITTFQSFVPM